MSTARVVLTAGLEHATSAPTVARRLVGTWLAGQSIDADTVLNAALVASELVTRAVDGAHAPPELRAECNGDTMRLEVVTRGVLTITPVTDPLDALGPMILAALCDDWGIDQHPGETTQWATLPMR
jgi:hypothetical protein